MTARHDRFPQRYRGFARPTSSSFQFEFPYTGAMPVGAIQSMVFRNSDERP